MLSTVIEKLDTIPNGELSIYLPFVSLKKSEKEIIGAGHLLNDKDGNLKLTLINKIQLTREEDNAIFEAISEEQLQLGTLRSLKDYCYEMSGRDEHGFQKH